jgi:16S rRNA processing protein RimM
MSEQLICVGVISSAYHLQGLVKITSFTEDPQNICKLNCKSIDGKKILCNFIKKDKDKIICRIDGVNNRNDAEKIIGTKLYIMREDLPDLEESEYYITDLIGLDVIDIDDKPIGKVHAVHNFGAGEIIEISFKDKKSEIYSFTKEIFPEITKTTIRFVGTSLY